MARCGAIISIPSWRNSSSSEDVMDLYAFGWARAWLLPRSSWCCRNSQHENRMDTSPYSTPIQVQRFHSVGQRTARSASVTRDGAVLTAAQGLTRRCWPRARKAERLQARSVRAPIPKPASANHAHRLVNNLWAEHEGGVILDWLLERQFGTRKYADSHRTILRRGESSGAGAKVVCDELFAHFGWACSHSVQTVIAHLKELLT